MERGLSGELWRMAFDETLEPVGPVLVGRFDGTGISLARDPVGGSLIALVRSTGNDFVILELDRQWLRGEDENGGAAQKEPVQLFSLREWLRALEEGDVAPGDIPFHPSEIAERMAYLRVDELDFISFDALGSLYMGAQEANLVLKFELARPSGRYAVGVSAGVIERAAGLTPTVRLHAWRKRVPGR